MASIDTMRPIHALLLLSLLCACSDASSDASSSVSRFDVVITPASPTVREHLSCALTTDEAVDQSALGALHYSWSVNGVARDVDSDTLDAGYVRYDEVSCTVGTRAAGSVSATVSIANAYPIAEAPVVSPQPVRTGDVPRCSGAGYFDPDGDLDASTTRWLIDEVDAGDGVSPARGLVRGDAVTCVFIPRDGSDSGPDVRTTLIVENQPPSVRNVVISQPQPLTDPSLRCEWDGYADAESDADHSTIAWTVNGAPAGSEPVLEGVVTDDVVVCTVTPNDGIDAGEPVARTVTVGNAVPEIGLVVVDPPAGHAYDVFTCVWSGFADRDAGDQDLSFARWYVNDHYRSEGPSLSGGLVPGHRLECRVTPWDGHSEGRDVSAYAVVENSPPSIDSVSIHPSDPAAGDLLMCRWQGFYDADGSTNASRIVWRVNGVVVWDSPSLGAGFADGDVVSCEVTPSDGVSDGVPLRAQVTIGNRRPSLTGVSIAPVSPRVGDVLRCVPEGFTDPDGDADLTTITWQVAGAIAGEGETLAGTFAAGTVVRCDAVPYDGYSTGASHSATVVVSNTPGLATQVQITPATPRVGDTLSCQWQLDDPDIDQPDLSTVAWSVDGAPVGSGVILAGAFAKGQVVSCAVTPFDGVDTGPLASASALVVNTPPAIDAVAITPAAPRAGDVVSCGWTGFVDPDGDADASTVTWQLNGDAAGSGVAFSGSIRHEDTLTCRVVPHDGVDAGAASSASAVVANTPPVIAAAAITPDSVGPGSVTLTCETVAWQDADGHADQSTFTWFVDEVSVGVGPTLTREVSAGQVVRCAAAAFDGVDVGNTASEARVVIGGSTGDITIAPTSFAPGEALTVTLTDPDLDVAADLIDTATVSARNSVTQESEALSLTETGAATGVFTATLPTASAPAGPSDDGALHVQGGDSVAVEYDDAMTASGISQTITATATASATASGADGDDDGIGDATEALITGDPMAVQDHLYFVDPDPAIVVRDGTSWATAFADLEQLGAVLGTIPPGATAETPTYVAIADTRGYAATLADLDRWKVPLANGACDHIAFIGSLGPDRVDPGSPAGITTELNAPDARILDATDCANLHFLHLRFTGSGGVGLTEGGAMRLWGSSAVLDTVQFDQNEAHKGAGGGLYVGPTSAELLIRNSVFDGNDVWGSGGIGGAALYLGDGSTVRIEDSRFIRNGADSGSGGAVHAAAGAELSVTRTVFAGNAARRDGGALYVARDGLSGPFVLAHSLLSGNVADQEGGAVYVTCGGAAPDVRVFDTLMSANGAVRGGAVAVDDCDAARFDSSTFVFNEALASGGGGAFRVETVSPASPELRPMPEISDNILFGNVDFGGISGYSLVNLPAWGPQQTHENLIDDASSVGAADVALGEPEQEFDVAFYLDQSTSSALDLGLGAASAADKFGPTPSRTTDRAGTVDALRVDAGFHYPGPYAGDVVSAVTTSALQGDFGPRGQLVSVTLLDADGNPVSSGYRVAFEIDPGSAPVWVKATSSAQDPLVSAPHFVATDRGQGDYSVEISTNQAPGPDSVTMRVYVDGTYIDALVVPVLP